MLPRIKEVRPMPDYCLRIVFDDGRKVLYDVKDDMEQIESYRDLATIHGLFNQVQLDPSRTCVYWNDEIDLPSDTLYEYGKLIAYLSLQPCNKISLMSPSIPLRMEGFLSKSHQFPDDTVGHFNGADEHQHIEYQLANVVPDDRCRGKVFRYDGRAGREL